MNKVQKAANTFLENAGKLYNDFENNKNLLNDSFIKMIVNQFPGIDKEELKKNIPQEIKELYSVDNIKNDKYMQELLQQPSQFLNDRVKGESGIKDIKTALINIHDAAVTKPMLKNILNDLSSEEYKATENHEARPFLLETTIKDRLFEYLKPKEGYGDKEYGAKGECKAVAQKIMKMYDREQSHPNFIEKLGNFIKDSCEKIREKIANIGKVHVIDKKDLDEIREQVKGHIITKSKKDSEIPKSNEKNIEEMKR